MKRNRENKSRIRLISTFRLPKGSQRKLDSVVKELGVPYSELWHDIRKDGLHRTMFNLTESVIDEALKQDEDWVRNTFRNCQNSVVNSIRSLEYGMYYSLKYSSDKLRKIRE